jgi:lipopolysaccharide assembly protein A
MTENANQAAGVPAAPGQPERGQDPGQPEPDQPERGQDPGQPEPGQPEPGPAAGQAGGGDGRQAAADHSHQAAADHGQQHRHVIGRTRFGGVWLASALFALVLLLLLIFILENSGKVEISYLGLHGHLPLGVALLLAAVLGVLLAVIPGTGRIAQLRVAARRRHHAGPAAGRADTGTGQT